MPSLKKSREWNDSSVISVSTHENNSYKDFVIRHILVVGYTKFFNTQAQLNTAHNYILIITYIYTNLNTHGHTSVSYTHLDVYKRQYYIHKHRNIRIQLTKTSLNLSLIHIQMCIRDSLHVKLTQILHHIELEHIIQYKMCIRDREEAQHLETFVKVFYI